MDAGGGGDSPITDPTDPGSGGQTVYTVTPSVNGAGGSISPATAVSVQSGASTSFTLTPNPGYAIFSVDGTCGGTLNGNNFTTKPVTANCTVTATFATGGNSNGSYWTMGDYTYLNGPAGVVTFGGLTLSDGRPIIAAVMSTATESGGTDPSKSGPYPGGGLVMIFTGSLLGTHSIVPDATALVTADPAIAPMTVVSDIGTDTAANDSTSCATRYSAISGQITVTQTSDGAYHFSSAGSLPTAKSFDLLVGPNCAQIPPETMPLTIHDATAK